ncbi:L-histidine N(alpha)-methyltransferase [Shewanella sp. KT0246]|uniref:L-histidine N(alpha)-methyltransferase n=1 Tax=Shewanella sp. KT0246 TaxID=2815912 RepID=UPI001BBEABD4|nr:L-histidine N(alpha)-methyltransferase [Shewanella sp. KT0246]GIU50157.1 dimethylhistidine N-methyltransferase [Shewanella sp. KT0246]
MKISKIDNSKKAVEAMNKEQFAIDVLTGLGASPKSLQAKYFYDDTGSKIFQKITQHPDYYPTKTEYEILDSVKHQLADLINESEIDIIELGAGDGHKTQLIINGFTDNNCRVNYYPIDISEEAMLMLKETISPHPFVECHGIVAEYFEGLRQVRETSKNRQLVLFLGSNIGNFDRVQNQGFLRRLWMNMDNNDYLLVGFDLKKDVDVLTKAYNDSSGLTSDFNLNLLTRINNELGGDFDVSKFQHFGVYSPLLGAMESYVIATEAQSVYIGELKRHFHFEAFEPIHLEFSFKFLKTDIDFISQKTGFEVIRHFSDSKDYFIDSLWQVQK